MAIPIYLFTGFIESGKTSLIKETLNDENFNTGERTLLLCCEEGIEEYDLEKLKNLNTHLEIVDDLDSGFDLAYLKELDDKYTPERVMIEYNGTWDVTSYLEKTVPIGWQLAQIVATVDTSTFTNYINNMKSLMYEQLRYADLVIFNRYTSDIKKTYLRSNIRAYNRIAQIIYENVNNQIEDITEDELPFDLSKEVIEIEPDDYGMWYMDAIDHPRKYEGKILSFTGLAFPTQQFNKDILAVGRFAMVCCAQDKAFLGMGVLDNDGKAIREGSWINVKGKVRVDYDPESNSDYISLINSEIKEAKGLDNPDVVF